MVEHGLSHLDCFLSPQDASAKLHALNLKKELWHSILNEGVAGDHAGSHEVQALIKIALGNSPKNLKEEYLRMRGEI